MKRKTNNQRTECEIISRVVGYLRPIDQWNEGKIVEFKDRKLFKVDKDTSRPVK